MRLTGYHNYLNLFISTVKKILCFGLIFLIFNANAQPRLKDSLENLLKEKDKIDEEYIDWLNQLSFEYLKSDPVIGINLVNKAFKLADSIDYEIGQLEATINKGNGFLINGLNDQALEYYYKALEFEFEDLPIEFIYLYNSLGENFKRENQFDSSLHYFHKAWNHWDKFKEKLNPSLIIANLAELHLKYENIDSAKYYFMLSHKYAETENELRGKSYALFGLAEISIIEDDLKTGMDLHKESLGIRRDLDDKRAIIQSLIKISIINQKKGNYQAALAELNEAEELSKKSMTFDLLNRVNLEKVNYYEKLKDFQTANVYLRKYNSLHDSIENASFQLRVNNIKNALQSELGDIKINSLLYEQDLQKQSIKTQQTIILAIILLILILTGFLYQYNHKLKLQSELNEKLNELNKEITRKNYQIEEINRTLDTQLIHTSHMLEEGQKITKLGSWEYNLLTSEMNWTEETFRHLGLKSSESTPSFKTLKEALPLEEYEKLKSNVFQMVNNLKPADFDLKTLDKGSNKEKYFKVRLIPQIEKNKLVRVYGTNLDVTENVLNEKHEEEIINSLLRMSRESSLRETIFDQFIEKLLSESAGILGVERASFWYYNKDRKSIINVKQFKNGNFTDDESYEIFEKDYPIYFKALQDNRTINASNALTDIRTTEFSQKYLQPYLIISMLDAQIRMDEKLIGVLCYEKTHQQKNWTYSDQRYVGTLSDIVSYAFSSYLYKKLEREKVRLIDRLVKKNKNLKEFAFVISHNLRGPLTQVMGLSDLYYNPENKEIRPDIISRINTASNNLDRVIKDLAEILSQQDEDQNITEWLKPAEIVQEVIISEKEFIDAHKAKVYVQISSEIQLKSNKKYFTNIVHHLLVNAIKFRKPDREPSIIISLKDFKDEIKLSVSDNGRGIDLVNFKDKLFKMYQRFHLDTEGKGIGLYIVKSQVELLGGHIDLDSAKDTGTVVTITIPLQDSEQPFEKYLKGKIN